MQKHAQREISGTADLAMEIAGKRKIKFWVVWCQNSKI
jgi:hypothetical protein